jgi:hypothetical protein
MKQSVGVAIIITVMFIMSGLGCLFGYLDRDKSRQLSTETTVKVEHDDNNFGPKLAPRIGGGMSFGWGPGGMNF